MNPPISRVRSFGVPSVLLTCDQNAPCPIGLFTSIALPDGLDIQLTRMASDSPTCAANCSP